jgi:hypothetical protein
MNAPLEYLIYNLQEIGLSEDKIYNLLERLSGFRIYIRKTDLLRYHIKKRYNQLKGVLPYNEIIKLLSKELEKSESRIRFYLSEIKV